MRFATVAGAIVLALGMWLRPRSAPSTAALAMDAVPARPLPTQEWPATLSRFPRHFRRSEANEWACMDWNASILGGPRGEAVMLQYSQSVREAEFVLARGREREFSASRSVERLELSLAEFWRRCAAGAERVSSESPAELPLLYHSGPLADWGASLAADAAAAPSRHFVADRPLETEAAAWPGPALNVWMGQAGVLATAHFDTSHNVVTQLVGRKRWLLWPPDQLPHLRMHPATHPSRRQTRMQLSRRGAAAGYAATRAHSVDLGPGESLYVPPFWAHAVLSSTDAVSISVLSPSWEEAVFGSRVKGPALPFGRLPLGAAAKDRAARAVAVGLFVRQLLPRVNVLGGESARSFVASLHRARHAPIGTANEEAAAEAAAADAAAAASARDIRGAQLAHDLAMCAALEQRPAPDGAAAWIEKLLPSEASLASAAAAAAAALAERRGERALEKEKGAREPAGLEAGSSGRGFTAPIARELLGGWVEELAAWAVGEGRVAGLLGCWVAPPQSRY